jgi:hypothetical protein
MGFPPFVVPGYLVSALGHGLGGGAGVWSGTRRRGGAEPLGLGDGWGDWATDGATGRRMGRLGDDWGDWATAGGDWATTGGDDWATDGATGRTTGGDDL